MTWDEVKRKAKANAGEFVNWDDQPYRGRTPRKRIEQCFVIQDVVWSFKITDRYTNEIHELETNNSDLEREFKAKHKARYQWE